MLIRKAKKEDLRELEKLDFLLAMEISRKDFFKKDREIFKKQQKKHLLKKFNKKNSIFFVVEKNNKLIGFTSGYIAVYPKFFKISKTGHIRDIYIKKPYRREGLGEKLMKAILQHFKNKNIKAAQLTVLTNNKPALKLYQGLGFRENRKKMVKKL